MKGRQTIFDLLLSVAMFVLLVFFAFYCIREAKGCYSLGYSIFSPEAMDSEGDGKTVTVTVTSDMSALDIGRVLEEAGLIENKYVFLVQERFSENHGHLMPGTYELSTEMLPEEMMDIMSESYIESDEEPSSETAQTSSETAQTSETQSEAAETEETAGENGDGTSETEGQASETEGE